jgi:hypothetical protein
MPENLMKCVADMIAKGHSQESAYAICSASTGWIKRKGGGWKNKKTKKVYKGK